ncbi:MAG: LPS export ABC transporter periplasmic protein LptC [Endozoicomonadaceae bacterium]|nr:LPS export ABC transporter periplasmic protein LptC [Endozoicomonadaceae bacterium]
MPLRQILFMVVSVVLAIGAGYRLYKTNLKVSHQITTNPSELKVPDFFSYNVHIREFNESGQLKSDLTANEINHFPHNEITLLSSPALWNYSDDLTYWHTVADRGRILPDGKTLELKNNVLITQIADSTPQLRMHTDLLTIDSNQDFFHTDRPVVIFNSHSLMKANGMKTFYKQDFVHLKSKVRGVYEPR